MADNSKPKPAAPPKSLISHYYLLTYNIASFLLWSYILAFTLSHLFSPFSSSSHHAPLANIYPSLLPILSETQTLALLEVVHAAVGLVRASPLTTGVQIGGKNLVVWTVMVAFPRVVLGSTGNGVGSGKEEVVGWGLVWFLGCLLAWGCSETVRYGYFVVQLIQGDAPGWLKWLRYNSFLILYPIGLLSEAGLVYLSLVHATGISTFYRGYLLLGLLTYLPAGPFLYTHMLAQRRKVMKQLREKQQ